MFLTITSILRSVDTATVSERMETVDVGVSTWVGHPQAFLQKPVKVEHVMVDAGIAHLIRALWGLGFWTEFSCEGWPEGNPNPGFDDDRGYILFATEEQAGAFYLMSEVEGLYLDKRVVRFDPAILRPLTEFWMNLT